MNISTKLLKAAAGQAGGAGLDVDEVFSTFLYDGSSSAQTINNGIDLSGEGGLVWIKERSASFSDHALHDTERGIKNPIFANHTVAENTYYNTNNLGITAFNSNGFTVASGANMNDAGDTAVSWTWRKAPKFFDIVKYDSSSGNVTNFGSAGATVNHNLGSVPGMIIVKCTSTASTNWKVYHRGLNGGTNPEQYEIELNQTGAEANSANSWNDTAPTSTQFTLGASGDVNNGSRSYVAYLFAHNDSGDGGFGPDGDQDIIKCGSLTTDSNGLATVNLGFEPQWLMIKRATTTGDWQIVDNLRGFVNNSSGGDAVLKPNSSDAESSFTHSTPTATGFLIDGNVSNHTIIYMAIRRGPLAAPEDATKVFALGTRGASTPGFTSNFPVDMFIRRYTTGSGYPDIGSRLTGAKAMQTSENFAEGNDSSSTFDHMNGYYNSSSADSNHFSYMWKRAPSYFDCVCYSGTGSARTVPHGLTVPAEMIWVKSRSDAYDWVVYHKDLGTAKHISLNRTNASAPDNSGEYWGGTTPTDSVFSLGTYFRVNGSAKTFIAYLFATAPGVSKVGSYTGNAGASTINVDCGFSSGARFVLIKESSGTGDWWVFDTVRGLVAGNDAALKLNTTDAESSFDYIDPYSGGFSLQTNSGINTNGATFIFYAIA